MVVKEKKQYDEIQICIDLRKFNDACIDHPFPTPLIDEVLENVGGQEAYSLTYGFSCYHQIKITPEYQSKTTFASLMVETTKITFIANLEASKNIKQSHAMLGHTGYYRKFIKAYAQIIAPMEKLLKKDATFFWDEDCRKSLDVLKVKMVTVPMLVFSDWKKEFHVHVDASCIVLGMVLTQPGKGDFDHPIEFASRKLSKA
eukprot:PITA_07696